MHIIVSFEVLVLLVDCLLLQIRYQTTFQANCSRGPLLCVALLSQPVLLTPTTAPGISPWKKLVSRAVVDVNKTGWLRSAIRRRGPLLAS